MATQHTPHLGTLIQKNMAGLIAAAIEHILLLSLVKQFMLHKEIQNPDQSFIVDHGPKDTLCRFDLPNSPHEEAHQC